MGFRKPALTKEFVVYSSSDPCVKVLDAEKYEETLDPQYLELQPGAAQFVLTPITTRRKLEAYPADTQRKASPKVVYRASEALVRASWRRVTNFEVGGEPLEIELDDDGLVKQEIIDAIQDENLIFELGNYVRQISHLP